MIASLEVFRNQIGSEPSATAVRSLSDPQILELVRSLGDVYRDYEPLAPGGSDFRACVPRGPTHSDWGFRAAATFAHSVAVLDPFEQIFADSSTYALALGMATAEAGGTDFTSVAPEAVEASLLETWSRTLARLDEEGKRALRDDIHAALRWTVEFEQADREGVVVCGSYRPFAFAGNIIRAGLESSPYIRARAEEFRSAWGSAHPYGEYQTAVDALVPAALDASLAHQTQARFVPTTSQERDFIEHVLLQEPSSQREARNQQVVAALEVVADELPLAHDAQTVLAIRRSEDTFADWQAALRTAVHGLEGVPIGSENFRERAQELLTDELTPRLHAMQRSLARRMGSNAKREVATLTLGGVGLYGLSLDMNVAKAAFVGLPIAAVARLVATGLFPDKARGANVVAARLQKGR